MTTLSPTSSRDVEKCFSDENITISGYYILMVSAIVIGSTVSVCMSIAHTLGYANADHVFLLKMGTRWSMKILTFIGLCINQAKVVGYNLNAEVDACDRPDCESFDLQLAPPFMVICLVAFVFFSVVSEFYVARKSHSLFVKIQDSTGAKKFVYKALQFILEKFVGSLYIVPVYPAVGLLMAIPFNRECVQGNVTNLVNWVVAHAASFFFMCISPCIDGYIKAKAKKSESAKKKKKKRKRKEKRKYEDRISSDSDSGSDDDDEYGVFATSVFLYFAIAVMSVYTYFAELLNVAPASTAQRSALSVFSYAIIRGNEITVEVVTELILGVNGKIRQSVGRLLRRRGWPLNTFYAADFGVVEMNNNQRQQEGHQKSFQKPQLVDGQVSASELLTMMAESGCLFAHSQQELVDDSVVAGQGLVLSSSTLSAAAAASSSSVLPKKYLLRTSPCPFYLPEFLKRAPCRIVASWARQHLRIAGPAFTGDTMRLLLHEVQRFCDEKQQHSSSSFTNTVPPFEQQQQQYDDMMIIAAYTWKHKDCAVQFSDVINNYIRQLQFENFMAFEDRESRDLNAERGGGVDPLMMEYITRLRCALDRCATVSVPPSNVESNNMMTWYSIQLSQSEEDLFKAECSHNHAAAAASCTTATDEDDVAAAASPDVATPSSSSSTHPTVWLPVCPLLLTKELNEATQKEFMGTFPKHHVVTLEFFLPAEHHPTMKDDDSAQLLDMADISDYVFRSNTASDRENVNSVFPQIFMTKWDSFAVEPFAANSTQKKGIAIHYSPTFTFKICSNNSSSSSSRSLRDQLQHNEHHPPSDEKVANQPAFQTPSSTFHSPRVQDMRQHGPQDLNTLFVECQSSGCFGRLSRQQMISLDSIVGDLTAKKQRDAYLGGEGTTRGDEATEDSTEAAVFKFLCELQFAHEQAEMSRAATKIVEDRAQHISDDIGIFLEFNQPQCRASSARPSAATTAGAMIPHDHHPPSFSFPPAPASSAQPMSQQLHERNSCAQQTNIVNLGAFDEGGLLDDPLL